MGWDKISKGKIGSAVSLKALALGLFLTPATMVAPPLATPAMAQFYFRIPMIRIYGGGRYHRGGYRHSRHHRGGGGGEESNATPSAPPPGKGPQGSSDY